VDPGSGLAIADAGRLTRDIPKPAERNSVAASTPIGPSSPLVRTIGILTVIVALVGVIAIFTKGSDNDRPSGTPVGGGTPIATPTGLRSSTPPPSPTISPSPSSHHTGSSAPVPTASTAPTGSATATTSAHPHRSAAPTSPAASPRPTSTPTANGGNGQPTLRAPALGNYSYATSGGEGTSFPGTSRTFPKTTTVSIAKAGCGVDQTWKPLSSHVETEQLCVINNQIHLVSYSTTLSFFGQTITQKFTCASNSYIYSPTLKPGDTWAFTCKTKGSKVVQHLKAVGFSTIDVGGTGVRTLHISVSSKVSGSDSGSSHQDVWIATTSRSLMIRNESNIHAKQGGVTYDEASTIELKHLQPS